MFVTKTALSRRTVLRGLGTALALPFLDAMTPAFARGQQRAAFLMRDNLWHRNDIEEAYLRAKFGDAYDAYAEKRTTPMLRKFSWQRAIHNREHHTMAGLTAALLILLLKL